MRETPYLKAEGYGIGDTIPKSMVRETRYIKAQIYGVGDTIPKE